MSYINRGRLAPLEFKDADPNDPLVAIRALGESIDKKFGDLSGSLKKTQDALDAEIARRNRPGTDTDKGDDEKLQLKAWTTFLRQGKEALGADEVKSLHVSDDTSGGYLAPAEFVAEVDKNLVQFSPVRQAARVGQTASGSVIIPKRTGQPTGAWVGETETRSATASTYGQAEIPVDEYSRVSWTARTSCSRTRPSTWCPKSASIWARNSAAQRAPRSCRETASRSRSGFMSDTNLSYTASGSATLIQADGLIDLFYALKPFYRQRATWMMNGSSLAAIRKLKDGDGQYLWRPGLSDGQPETILGRPVVEAVDMPDVAGNAYPIVPSVISCRAFESTTESRSPCCAIRTARPPAASLASMPGAASAPAWCAPKPSAS
jgi:predicted phage gp36 major capsid-like protein